MSKTKPQSYDFHLAQAVKCGRIAWDAYHRGNAVESGAYARDYREHAAKCDAHLRRAGMSHYVAELVYGSNLQTAHQEAP